MEGSAAILLSGFDSLTWGQYVAYYAAASGRDCGDKTFSTIIIQGESITCIFLYFLDIFFCIFGSHF